MESEESLPCLQELSTSPYTEPDQFCPYHLILFFCVLFIIILFVFYIIMYYLISFKNELKNFNMSAENICRRYTSEWKTNMLAI
jgi:hypothetical protein